MLLCNRCNSIPFHEIFRHMNGEDIPEWPVGTWLEQPIRPHTRLATHVYFRWHVSMQHLGRSVVTCSFCRLVESYCRGNYYYEFYAKQKSSSIVWLQLPLFQSRRNPHLRVCWYDGQYWATSGRIFLSTTPDTGIAPYFDNFTPIADPLHPAVLGNIDAWMRECEGTHPDCTNEFDREARMPTRILDLSSLPGREQILALNGDWHEIFNPRHCRLIDAGPDKRGEYIALSYCWGDALPLVTITKNLEVHKGNEGIPFKTIPKTLQDAMFLVRYLGFRYLWVDSLCIIQDCKKDWEQESTHMADVYSRALLTIAALRASHSGEGFLQFRETKGESQIVFASVEGPIALFFRYEEDYSPGSLRGSAQRYPLKIEREEPLLGRVWCFQERVLARRVLYFGVNRTYWECEQCLWEEGSNSKMDSYEECSLQKIAHGLNLMTGDDNQLVGSECKAWDQLLQEYTSRTLTYGSDKLPALSGIISRLQQLTADDCYAGIWRRWFMLGLLWRFQDPEFDSWVYVQKAPYKVAEYRAPSWSFAANEGVVLYSDNWGYHNSEHYGSVCARLEQCILVPRGLNALGELESGFAQVHASLTTITYISKENTKNGREGYIRLLDERQVEVDVFFDFETYDCCTALVITPYAGLVILSAKGSRNTYTRSGIFQMRSVPERIRPSLSAVDYPELQTVVLI